VEVFPERPGEPIVRRDDPERRGAFTVTLPAAEAAHHVTIVRIAPGVEGAAGRGRIESRAVDLATFALGAR
jgi:hypothetical protein